MPTLDKCYSRDDEEFNCADFADLIDGYEVPPEVGDVYWEADCRTMKPTDGINRYTVDSLLEGMDERVSDVLGDCFDSECSNVTDEAKAELHGLIEAWATKHIDLSRYWTVMGKSRECKFTTEDLE